MPPAISGVARQMQEPGLGRYITGLWENYLPYKLAWRSDFDWRANRRGKFIPKRPCERHLDFVALSFSWASRAGIVRYGALGAKEELNPRFKVLEIMCEPRSLASPFREISNQSPTFLRLLGRLVAGKVGIVGPSKSFADTSSLTDGDMDESIWGLEICLGSKRPFTQENMLSFDTPADKMDCVNQRVYFFALCRPGQGPSLNFSVLRKVDGSLINAYRRVGIVHHDLSIEDWSKLVKGQEIVLV
jgi:hypothetical protein